MPLPELPALFDAMSSVVVARFGEDGSLQYANAGFSRLYEGSAANAWYLFSQPRLADLTGAPANDDGVVYQGLLTIGDPEGTMYSVTGSVFVDSGTVLVIAGYAIDELEAAAEVLRDLNNALDAAQRDLVRANRELARREATIRQLSLTDALTGVGNRRHLDEHLALEVERSERFRSPLSLAILDIDHFKRVNDTYGHEAGDRVLQATGGLLKNSLRLSDTASRMGGEEFVLLLAGSTAIDAVAGMERLRTALAAMKIEGLPRVTASFGVAEHAPGETGAALLARADGALYEAKQGGRNRVVCAPPASDGA